MSIKKQYLKTRAVCKVTFSLPKEAASGAQAVYIVGDFNSWNLTGNPMRRSKDGKFSITISVKPGREYQFRYLLDGTKWENDWSADKYVANDFGTDNSVLIV